MRSIINEIAEQNKIWKLAHLEIVKNSDGVLNRIIRHQAIFTKLDIEKAVKEIPEEAEKQKLLYIDPLGIIISYFPVIS